MQTPTPAGLVERDDSVLVIVDTQPGFFADEGMDAQDTARAAATVERIAWMAGMAALLGIPAVVVEERPEREGPTAPEILARVPPGTPVVPKPTFGLAGCPEAVEAIRATGRGTAVLVGFETDVCVAQSAIGLAGLGFRAIVLEDAAYTTGEQRARARAGTAGRGGDRAQPLQGHRLRVAARGRRGDRGVRDRPRPGHAALAGLVPPPMSSGAGLSRR